MSRYLTILALALAALGHAVSSFAADAPADPFAGKGLRADGTVYVLRGEDEVKKAWDLAETRLKEYRRLRQLGQAMSTRDEASRKSMAGDLTKQRAAMKQQLDRAVPQFNAQIRTLTQQQSALRQQMNGLQYGTSAVTTMAHNQLANQHNALTDQINALQSQSNQLIDAYNELGEQINAASTPVRDRTRRR